jgi:hypothetical protein
MDNSVGDEIWKQLLYNMRHIQHYVAQLKISLRQSINKVYNPDLTQP